MDLRLEQALDSAKFRYTLHLEKRRLQEKLQADLTYAVNGGQFFIDRNFIVFLNLLTPAEGTLSTTILDDNLNPIHISDITKLQRDVLALYTRVVNQYSSDFENLRKKRTVASVVDYE
jgi:hypothetical protein